MNLQALNVDTHIYVFPWDYVFNWDISCVGHVWVQIDLDSVACLLMRW